MRATVGPLLALTITVALTAACGVAAPAAAVPLPTPAATPPRTTIVSITFDDGQATHFEAAALLQDRGMVGTFYVNSNLVGRDAYYVEWGHLDKMARAGNEIGGHTRNHAPLSGLDQATIRSEICDDRTTLIARGFAVTSFAYPESRVTPAAQRVVRECGYATGRAVGGLHGPGCGDCPYAESLPPADPTAVRTLNGITTKTTLADLQAGVTGAETHGGGWVVLAFHSICAEPCPGENSTSTALFTEFLDWLVTRRPHGVVVRTVEQAMSGGAPTPP